MNSCKGEECMPQISVIMPSYNVVGYIGECIESVINQSFQNIEIIIVDAMSTDGTQDILMDYSHKDSRINVVASDVKSYGFQLNLGIKIAKGDYIAIIETDDVVEPKMLEILFEEAEKYDLDYVKGDFNLFASFENGVAWKKKVAFNDIDSQKYYCVINPKEHPELYLLDVYLWRGIYKRDFLIKNEIKFHETKGAAFQDVGFMFQVLGLAEQAMYVKEVLYNYRQNNASSSIFNINGFRYLSDEYPFVKQQYVKRSIYNENFEMYYHTRMFHQITARYRTMAAYGKVWENTETEREELWRIIKSAYENGCFEEAVLGKSLWFELLQYVGDEKNYWKYQLSIYDAKRKYLMDLLTKVKNSKQVVFYSKSVLGGFLNSLIKEANINTEMYYCDNDESKQGLYYMGTKILSVIEATELYPGALYIIANNRYNAEMKKQLLQLGIHKTQIHVCMLNIDILMLHMVQ